MRVSDILPCRGNFTQCWLLDTIPTSKLVSSVYFSKCFDQLQIDNCIFFCVLIHHIEIFFVPSIVHNILHIIHAAIYFLFWGKIACYIIIIDIIDIIIIIIIIIIILFYFY